MFFSNFFGGHRDKRGVDKSFLKTLLEDFKTMVFHFYRGNLRGGLFFHAQAEDQCKNAGMQKYIFTTFSILFRSNILCNA